VTDEGVDTSEEPELGASECSVPSGSGASDDQDARHSDDEEIA
jgi:hypothetical protein